MTNYCVFCGQETQEGQVTCPVCAVLIKDLTPDQKKALERLQKDEESRLAFATAWAELKEALVRCLRPVGEMLARIAEQIHLVEKDEEADT